MLLQLLNPLYSVYDEIILDVKSVGMIILTLTCLKIQLMVKFNMLVEYAKKSDVAIHVAFFEAY